MMINTTGTYPILRPTFCARSNRKASLKRARVNTAPSNTTYQKLRGSRRMSDKVSGTRLSLACARCAGSCTPNNSNATAMNAGITAIHNTLWMLSANSAMNNNASNGPRKAPTESSDCRRP